MSLLSKILTSVGLMSAAAESGVDNLNAEMAARMPDQAQAITDEQHLVIVADHASRVNQAEEKLKKETQEATAKATSLNIAKAAANKENEKLVAMKIGGNTTAEQIQEQEKLVTELLDQVDAAKQDFEKEETDRIDAQVYLDVCKEGLDLADQQFKDASNAVRDAADEMQAAAASKALAELKLKQQQELKAMRSGKPIDSMASAMKARAAKIRAEAAGVDAKAAAISGAQTPKMSEGAAAALAAASGTPVTLEDRAAALLG